MTITRKYDFVVDKVSSSTKTKYTVTLHEIVTHDNVVVEYEDIVDSVDPSVVQAHIDYTIRRMTRANVKD